MPKKYTVCLQPISDTYYEYEVNAEGEGEAEEQAFDLLQDAIGWDAAKDWECSYIRDDEEQEDA